MPTATGLNLFRRVTASQQPLPRAQLRRRQEALAMAREEQLITAAYSYQIVTLDEQTDGMLVANGERLNAPRLLPESGELTAIACGVCTLGAKLDQRIGELFKQQQAALALELDRLGNQLLFAVDRLAQDRILADVKRRALTVAGELRPGDPGLDIEAQSSVMRLAQAQTINVILGSSAMMYPARSTSMVLGVGIDLPRTSWFRCTDCPSSPRCRIAAEAAMDTTAAGKDADLSGVERCS